MKFGKYIKGLKFENEGIEQINPFDIRAQYNPDRFKLWESLSSSPDVLGMSISPHYKLLARYDLIGDKVWNKIRNTPYYKMHRLYGKNHKWTIEKIKKFLSLFDDMKINLMEEPVEVLRTPLVNNPYNKGWEIYEGHHRVACATFLKWDEITCQVIKASKT